MTSITTNHSISVETNNLNGGYQRHQPVIGDITIQLRPGQILGISGLNGSGKSTLIKSIIGLAPYRSGIVKISNINVSFWTAERIFRLNHIGYLPQYERGFAGLTIQENIVIAERANPYNRNLDLENEYRDRLLGDFISRTQYVGDLSGGERTRVALFCLVASCPDLAFLDEPSAGLDVGILSHLHDLIEIWKKEMKTILLIEQNTSFLDSVATQRAELVDVSAAENKFGYSLKYLR